MDSPGPSVALLLSLLLCSVPTGSSFFFPFPSDCDRPTSDSCPTCCKNLRNLASAGEPALVVKDVKHVDKCISICAAHNHSFYGISNRHVCGCFDECSVIEVPPSPFTVTSGYVPACLKPCFQAPPAAPMCSCPEHSTCLPGKNGDFRCCCKEPYGIAVEVNGQMTCARSPNSLPLRVDM